MIEMMKQKMIEARKSELKWRLKSELRQRVNEGWYVVFNTLTVRTECMDEVFAKGSDAWRKYVGKISYHVNNSVDNDNNSLCDNHSYFGVVERGDKTGRLHIHAVHCVRVLPEGCQDPNYGARVPYKRVIEEMRKFWTYGFSMPIAVRHGSGDAYAKIGWQWPVIDRIKCERLQPNSPDALAEYVSKYVNKAYEENVERIWRTKMSRGFGNKVLERATSKMTTVQLRKGIMTRQSGLQMLVRGRSTPLTLMKKQATKEWMKRWKKKSRNLWTLLRGLEPQKNILEQLENLKQTKSTKSKMQNCGTLMMKNTIETATSKVGESAKEVYGEEASKWQVSGPDVVR